MSDIALDVVDNCFDIVVEDGDLKADDGLETAVAISVFTDKRIEDDELPDLEDDKRGWWGDSLPDVPNDQIGSRLWLLERGKRTTEVLRRSEDYIEESLQWMVEDGVASSVISTSSYDSSGQLVSETDIARPAADVERYQILWEKQEVRRL